MSAYERVRSVVDELDRRFYGLLDACDQYAHLLEELTAEEGARREPNRELMRRYAHQRREVDELREQLEGAAMDTFLRIITAS